MVDKQTAVVASAVTYRDRITNTWNSLPNFVVLAPSLNSFKNRLNKFWKSQSCIYNYKDNWTGNTIEATQKFRNNIIVKKHLSLMIRAKMHFARYRSTCHLWRVDLSNYWHVWRVEYGAHIIVTSLFWRLDCSLLIIKASQYIGPTRSFSCLLFYHGLYGSTSCCISHGPSQWERAIFDPPQIGDPWTDFYETWNI